MTPLIPRHPLLHQLPALSSAIPAKALRPSAAGLTAARPASGRFRAGISVSIAFAPFGLPFKAVYVLNLPEMPRILILMDKRLPSILTAALLVLMTLPLAAQNEPPGRMTGLSGDGLHLYPLGWSSEGRWGTLIARDAGRSGTAIITAVVIDAVTDELLYESEDWAWDGGVDLEIFWESRSGSVLTLMQDFQLEQVPNDVRDASFSTGGVNYTFKITSPGDNDGRYGLSIESSRNDSKSVYYSPAGDPLDKADLKGCLISPFEQRALAVILEYTPYGGEGVRYRFTGSHLTQGFRSAAARPPGFRRATGGVMAAVVNGQEYLLQARLQDGASPDETDTRGYSALLMAARLGHWNMIPILTRAGARTGITDSHGRSALHYAAFAADRAAVEALLAAGSAKTLRDAAGRTPLELCPDDQLRSLLR